MGQAHYSVWLVDEKHEPLGTATHSAETETDALRLAWRLIHDESDRRASGVCIQGRIYRQIWAVRGFQLDAVTPKIMRDEVVEDYRGFDQ